MASESGRMVEILWYFSTLSLDFFACCGDKRDAEVIEDNLHLGNGGSSKSQQKCCNLM